MSDKIPNPAAVALGKLGAGKRKTLSKAERRRRATRMRAVQALRWKARETPSAQS